MKSCILGGLASPLLSVCVLALSVSHTWAWNGEAKRVDCVYCGNVSYPHHCPRLKGGSKGGGGGGGHTHGGNRDNQAARWDEAVRINNTGLGYYNQHDFATAIRYFEQASQIAPELTWIRDQIPRAQAAQFNDEGIRLDHDGQLDQAIASYQKALEANPDNPAIRNNFAIAVNNRGHQLEGSGDLDRALEYYKSALQSNPGNRASAQAFAGNIQRVQDLIQRRANAWSINNEGVKIENVDLDGAIRLYQQAFSLYPNDPVINGNLQRAKQQAELRRERNVKESVSEAKKIVAAGIADLARQSEKSHDAPVIDMEFTNVPASSSETELSFEDVAAQVPKNMRDAPNSGGKLSQFPNGNVQPDPKTLDETTVESGGMPAQGEELVSEGQRFGDSLVGAAGGDAAAIMEGRKGTSKDSRGIRKLVLEGGPAKGGNIIRSTVAKGNCVVVPEKLMSSPEFRRVASDRETKVETLRTFDKAVKALEQGEGGSSAPAALADLKQKLQEAKDALTKTDQNILYIINKANKREEAKPEESGPSKDGKEPETDDETLSPFDKQAADAIIKKVYDEPTKGEVGQPDRKREGHEE